MNLSITGKLSEKTRIEGHLSDNNAAVSESGSSATLKEIDNIYIRVDGPEAQLEFGDVLAGSDVSPLLAYRKKILGVTASYSGTGMAASGFAGTARGKYYRQILACTEGNQGPYSLSGASVGGQIFIVPGSEKVWLDGKLLPTEAYTLYYRDAEILFAPEHLISEQSRIVVEYSYQDQVFPRTSAGAEIRRNWEWIQLRSAFVMEKDDWNNPADPLLSRLSPDSLARITDSDSLRIALSTAIADSSGDYVDENGVWVYAGHGKGSHMVYFYRETRVGGYVRRLDSDGLAYFSYAPDEAGSCYFPRRWIETPGQLSSGVVALTAGKSEQRRLQIEQSYSASKPNLYRERSASTGGITDITLNYSPRSWEKHFSLSGKYWARQENTVSFEALFQPDFARQSGLQSSRDLRSILKSEAELSLNGMSLTAAWNNFQSYSEAARSRADLRLRSQRSIPFEFSLTRLYSGAFLPWYDLTATVDYPLPGKIQLKSEYLEEYHDSVFANLLPAFRRRFTQTLNLSESVRLQGVYHEDRERIDGKFQNPDIRQDLLIQLSRSRHSQLQFLSTLNIRQDRQDQQRQRYFLGQNRLQWRPASLPLSIQVDDNVNRSSENLREAVYVYAGEGLGNYRWDPVYGEYVPDPLGTHILRFELSPEKQQEISHKNEGSVDFSPRFHGKSGITVNAKLNYLLDYRAADFILARNLERTRVSTDNLYSGRNRFRQDIRLQSPGRKKMILLAWEGDRQQNLMDLARQQISSLSLFEIRYRSRTAVGSRSLYYQYRDYFREKLSGTGYQIRNFRNEAGAELSRPIFSAIDMKTAYHHSSNLSFFGKVFTTTVNSLELDLRYEPKEGERMRFQITQFLVSSDGPRVLPYESADGLNRGNSQQLLLTYDKQLSNSLSASLQLQRRTREGSRDLNLARMEIKAYF